MASVQLTVVGDIGTWAAGCVGRNGVTAAQPAAPPQLSFNHSAFAGGEENALSWREKAKSKFIDSLMMPELTPMRAAAVATVETGREYELDGVKITEMSWQLPYGARTKALYMVPASSDADSALPAILALHCHGGQKVFGIEKISKTDGVQHPMMAEHQDTYYGGKAWANEMAKRGYAVLVHDAFPFGSRRVLQPSVPNTIRQSCAPVEFQEEACSAIADRAAAAAAAPDAAAAAERVAMEEYNRWASDHEHVIAKSLLSAGLSWPGVLLAEDIAALDVLVSRSEVDATRVGCGGLSGGGLRTMVLGAVDARIGCTAQVGYFTTSADMVLQKSYCHSWQGLFPMLARELDIPDLVAMRCPLPSLVQHDDEDPLFTLAAAQEGLAAVKQSFTKAGFADNFVGSVYKGGHKFDCEMQAEAYSWFDRWLMPHGDGTPLARLQEKVAANAGAELQQLEAARAELDTRIAALKV